MDGEGKRLDFARTATARYASGRRGRRLWGRDGDGGHGLAGLMDKQLSAREHRDAFQVEGLGEHVHHRDCLEVVAGLYQRREVAGERSRIA